MICPKCNQDISELVNKDNRYCPICGSLIEEDIKKFYEEDKETIEIINEEYDNVNDDSNFETENDEMIVEDNVVSSNEEETTPVEEEVEQKNQEIVIERGPKLDSNKKNLPPSKPQKAAKVPATMDSVVPIGIWLLFLLGMSIPVVNIITFLICLFSKKYASRRNLILAGLLFAVIAIVILAVLTIIVVIAGPIIVRFVWNLPAVQGFIEQIEEYLTGLGIM